MTDFNKRVVRAVLMEWESEFANNDSPDWICALLSDWDMYLNRFVVRPGDAAVIHHSLVERVGNDTCLVRRFEQSLHVVRKVLVSTLGSNWRRIVTSPTFLGYQYDYLPRS